MTTINLKMQLKVLFQLQGNDSQIYGFNEEKNSVPKEIETLKLAFEEKKNHLAEQEKKNLELLKAKKDAELELAGKEEVTKKFQAQLYSLKTNKEYNTMLAQIQDSKADASRVEDKILEIMDKTESSNKNFEEAKKQLAEEEKIFNTEKKRVDDRLKEIENKISQLDVQRKQILPELDKKILSQYNRILENRQGLAIVEAKNNTCMGCNMFVPAQAHNLIKMYDRIVTCEVCNRILFIADE